jgi:uncharacterized membrane protein YphA (DoxX/SURF4 family)
MGGHERQAEESNAMIVNTLSPGKLRSAFAVAVRLGLGCLFLYSSLPKIRHPYDFLSSVYNYELVGPKVGVLAAMVLPWLELLVGICLVGGIFVSGALLVSMAMAGMFTFVITSALYRGLNISCGCFSASSTEQIGYATLIRACVILLFSMFVYISVVASHPAVTDKCPAPTRL